VSEQPKRRWYQFSLKTLLVLMVLCSLVLGAFSWRLQRAHRQARAVAALRSLGCEVGYEIIEPRVTGGFKRRKKQDPWLLNIPIKWLGEDFFYDVYGVTARGEQPGSPDEVKRFWQEVATFPALDYLTLEEKWIDHDGWKLLANSQSVRHLYLDSNRLGDEDFAVFGTMLNLQELLWWGVSKKITDAGVANLDELTELQSLTLSNTEITDAAAPHLAKHTKLQQLSLGSTHISDAGLAHLSELTDLRYLFLERTRVTDAALVHLQHMKDLEILGVSQTTVHGPGLANLMGLTKLRQIGMSSNPVTDEDLSHFASLSHLEELWLAGTRVTDDGMVQFKMPPAVKEIHLVDTAIGDRTLESLADCPNLKTVSIWNTKVTPPGVAKFKKALPACDISGP
jgi:hypothetical protein